MARPSGFWHIICLQVVAVLLCLSQVVLGDPSVNVALTAPFNSPPYLLELLETAARENESCYFPLLDSIANGRLSEAADDQELYNLFTQLLQDDNHISSKTTLSLFNFSLSLHSTAPRIEAQYQFYNTSVEPTVVAAQDAACPVWAHHKGKQYCSPTLDRAQQDGPATETMEFLPFDRTLGDTDAPPLILYADIMSPQFREFHHEFSHRARHGEISYRLRYRPSSHHLSQPLMMNGYGVALNFKRTDYIVIDDRAQQDESKRSETETDLDYTDDLTPLSASELSQLPYRAASFVLEDENPFDALVRLSQDFPRLAKSLAEHNVSESFITELSQQRENKLPPGLNQIWLNGFPLNDQDDVDAFSLLERIRREEALVKGLQETGFTGKEAVDLIASSFSISSLSDDEPLRFDYRDNIEGNKVIIWLNNIEKDERYAQWPSETLSLLHAMYPGQLPAVRREVHNVVIPVDLTNADDVKMVTSSIRMFINRRIPSRFGLVPSVSNQSFIPMVKYAHYLAETYGPMALLDYLQEFLAKGRLPTPDESILKSVVGELSPLEDKQLLSLDEVLNGDQYVSYIENTRAYFQRLAIGTNTQEPIFFANGVALTRDEEFLQSMAMRLSQDMNALSQLVFQGVYDDDSWLPSFYLQHALLGRNPIAAPEDDAEVKIIDMNEIIKAHSQLLDTLPKIPASKDSSVQEQASIILLTDLDSVKGQEQLRHLTQFQQDHPGLEVYLVHSEGSLGNVSSKLTHQGLLDSALIAPALDSSEEPGSSFKKADDESWLHREALLQSFGLNAGDTALIYNGRVVGPLSSPNLLDQSGLAILKEFEGNRRISPVIKTLKSLGLVDRVTDPTHLARITSHLAIAGEDKGAQTLFQMGSPARSTVFNQWSAKASSIVVSRTDDPIIFINATIDPASETAQRYLPILKVLTELDGVRVHIILNPTDKLQELSVKRFYRHVLSSAPSFDSNGRLSVPRAEFTDIPKKALLTLSMDVPQAWLVTSQESVYDLDNLLLSNVKEGSDVEAIYNLEYILVEGHSRDTTLNVFPRGVQLLLGTENQPHYMDTIIMANLGYFQFKSRPGYWKLSLKPGPSETIFNIDQIGDTPLQSRPEYRGKHLTLMSFQGKTLFPRLSRKKGHEKDDVLASESLMGPIRQYLSRGLKLASSLLPGSVHGKKANADINIFSVASGHLYERMLNIMMLSVMRHTNHTVKFWFIEQFLSPSFKSFLPHMAKEYGFEYEMVTYKWPHWLRSQREKQREIWGYKILFLDVLFPLSLDKVIFVDADQIVRTDMYDLVEFDLEGAPYGFTPMCDSRESMEGFRFWKQGYWKQYLGGLPYHISALYVVDLVRFRALAAGDRLRGQYQALSVDPNSLSNLDQDLPNHMQKMLPIKSLPQEWLWCETWCSDEALKTARTIDLCNNPLTKEPKLDRARRQVPEWTEYDEEIANLARRVSQPQQQQSKSEGQGMAHEEL
ncbi:hypothetical protein KEM54_003997 [Ascosphaera aggregata]|nr:hypothetical protein KEM54_003997 [Ascosphaera aggregata]